MVTVRVNFFCFIICSRLCFVLVPPTPSEGRYFVKQGKRLQFDRCFAVKFFTVTFVCAAEYRAFFLSISFKSIYAV